MTSEDDFQAILDADPSDWQTRLVFADWLQDRGDPRAEGYRALGLGRWLPCVFDGGAVWGGQCHPSYPFAPWRENNRGWLLPVDWFAAIGAAKNDFHYHGQKIWTLNRSRRLAENRAVEAFAKLPPARRAELLSGKGVADGIVA